MNRGQITAEIRRIVKDTSGDAQLQKWTDAVLQARENYVQEEMQAISGMLEVRATDIDVVSGTAEYSMPSNLLSVRQILIEDSAGNYTAITKTTEETLNVEDVDWREEKGDPTEYYLARGKIGLYPQPDYSRTGGLRVDGILKATDMTSDADVPFNSDYRYYFAHMGIVYGVARLCLMDDGKFNEASALNTQYNGILKMIMRQISGEEGDTRPVNVYEVSRIGARRTR